MYIVLVYLLLNCNYRVFFLMDLELMFLYFFYFRNEIKVIYIYIYKRFIEICRFISKSFSFGRKVIRLVLYRVYKVSGK